MELSVNLKKGEGWVLVFPRGKHFLQKYNVILDCNDKFFNEVSRWWKNSNFKRPYLDKNHEFAEKYGEFTEMRITQQGLELYLILNDDGRDIVKSDKYSYLSPTFADAKDSEGKLYKNVIFTVSLVNYPALLVLDKIQEQIALSMHGKAKNIIGGTQVNLQEIIAKKLKLSASADEMSILAEIEQLLEEGATIEQLKEEIKKMKESMAVVEQEKLTLEEEKEELIEEKEKLEEVKADLEKKIEEIEEGIEEEQKELKLLKKKMLKDESSRVIDDAIACGQYLPSLRDLKIEQYLTSPDVVKKELSLIPKSGSGRQKTQSGYTLTELSAEDRKVLEDAGYDLTDPKDMQLAQKFINIMRG